jgi:Fe-S cluster assembly ATP-binding protein
MGLTEYNGYRGQVLLDGKPLEGVPVDERARRGIALAWQEPARFEGLKVRSFIEAAARDKSPAQISAVLRQVGLEAEKYLDRAVDKTLSGGERKRIELASIMAMEPRVFMMDEPDSGIDVNALDHIFDALRMLKDKGTTVILITHSPTVLQQAEHAFLICCGKLIDKGSIERIRPYFEDKCIPCDHQNQPTVIETGDRT